MEEARVPRFAGVSIFRVALTLYFALTTPEICLRGTTPPARRSVLQRRR